MKRRTLKLFALLLAMVMVLALLPTAVFAEEQTEGGSKLETPPPNGYIRSPEHGTRAVSDAYARGDMETYYRLKGEEPTRDTLPSSYDSRNYNYVTSVKNQNPYGSCWAHAAMGSVESYMIKHGIPVGTGSAATTSLNLSETQHCYFNYSTAYDAEGMLTGDKCTLTGSDSCLDAGGNGEMSAYTLQRWCGVADESQSALQYSKASTVASSGLNSQYSYSYNVAHVQNSVWIPGDDIEGVKRAIMEYGAGNISYYESGSAYTYTCTIDTSSQSSSSHKWSNHAITIVGWDDSIAVSNFKPNKPSGKGAWICKNSWGTSYFNQGYMYISYEDTTVLEGYIYFYDAEPIDNYDHNYQYDGSCNVVTYGVGNRVGFANNTKVANVFTATGSQLLEAVALCNWDEALSYTVEIYKNPTTGNPSSGTLMTSQTGTLIYSGYYTIKLDNPVALAAGDTFSVVFTQSCPEADDEGKYVHTPYDANFNDTSLVSWASWTHTNHGNTSYYQEPNGAWTDCPDNGDYRIKAYTTDITYTVTAVSNNTAWGTVSVNGTKITASPAAGYYVSGYEVVSGTATATINGNIINVAPESDCTIKVIFAEKPTYTVKYMDAGFSAGSASALIYDEITLPSSVSYTPTGWTFSGWVSAELKETSAEPEFYAPGASYTVTANATLYALFTRTEGTGELIYRLVNDNLDDWSGNFVITSGKDTSLIALKSTTKDQRIENTSSGASVAYASTGMTLDGEVLRNVPDTFVFALAKNGSYYTIKNETTGFWIGTQSTYLHNMSSYQANYSDWNVEYDLYNICMKVANVASTQYTYLVKGSNSYFVVNTGYTTNKTQFWKEEVEGVTYYATEPCVDPAFMSQSLLLEGCIGVRFYVRLPEALRNANTNVSFTISGKNGANYASTVPYSESLKTNSNGYVGFTFYVNTIQMADTITATLHYGDGETLVKTYSVIDYFKAFDEACKENPQAYTENIANLIKAMADFGHFVQAYLDESNANWSVPTDHADMYKVYAENIEDYLAETTTAVAAHALKVSGSNSDIRKLTYKMNFESEMSIHLIVVMNSGFSGTLTATADGAECNITQQTATKYLVEIPNVQAHRLSHDFKINLTTASGTLTLEGSGLSYAKMMLDSNGTTACTDAAIALYRYSEMADAVIKN